MVAIAGLDGKSGCDACMLATESGSMALSSIGAMLSADTRDVDMPSGPLRLLLARLARAAAPAFFVPLVGAAGVDGASDAGAGVGTDGATYPEGVALLPGVDPSSVVIAPRGGSAPAPSGGGVGMVEMRGRGSLRRARFLNCALTM